jgi:hypothetical protein
MSVCHIYSNRHISDQVTNIKINDTIVLENTLSKKRWSLYFKVNTIDESALNIKYVTREEYMSTRLNFDVTVGNPPYTDGSAGKTNIWQHFVLHAGSDQQSWVIPSSWLRSMSAEHKRVREKFINHGIKYLKINPINSFQSATVRTVSVVLDSTHKGPTTICDTNETYKLEINSTDLILLGGNKLGTNLLRRLQTNKKFKFKNNKKAKLAKNYASIGTGSICIFNSLSVNGLDITTIAESEGVADNDIGVDRLVVGYLPSGTNYARNFGLIEILPKDTAILPDYYRYYPTTSVNEAKAIKSYLESKLVTFIQSMTRTSQTLDNPQLLNIPFWIPTSVVSDEEVYTYFELTQEECNYIEENVE